LYFYGAIIQTYTMKYLTPSIEKLSKTTSNKSLAKPGVSCGIFQDCHDSDLKYTKQLIKFNKSKNGK
jgi:hypothetical protein